MPYYMFDVEVGSEANEGETLQRLAIADMESDEIVAYIIDVHIASKNETTSHITSVKGNPIYNGPTISDYDIEKLLDKHLEEQGDRNEQNIC